MNPHMFAKQECSNYLSDGGCLGAMELFNLTDISPQSKCLLALIPMKPCAFFERVVLPTADWATPDQAERLEARNIYYKARKVEEFERHCPTCAGLLAKNQKYCTKCSRKQRLKSRKEHYYGKKSQTGQMLPNSSL